MSSCPHIPTGLALTHGSSLLISEAALPRVELCPLRWQLLPVMAPGRTGQDTCLQVAVEGGHGPEGVSWVSEPRALVLGSHSG